MNDGDVDDKERLRRDEWICGERKVVIEMRKELMKIW